MAEPDDQNEQRMLEYLARRSRGEKDMYNPFEAPPTPAEQQDAMKQYIAIKQAQEARHAREFEAMRAHADTLRAQAEAEKMKADAAADVERLRLEAEKNLGQNDLERERLRLEGERIRMAQAEMVLRAMEMAARNPDMPDLRQLAIGLAQDAVGTRMLTVKDG